LEDRVKEIRLHGLGGQGAAKGSEMLTFAFIVADKYAASFPMYGAARKGGSVTAFCRYDEIPVREKTKIYTPDCIIVFNDSLIGQQGRGGGVFDGIKPGGIMILNTEKEITESPHPNLGMVACVDADKIAMEEIGIPAVNTTMLAAFAAATGWVSLDAVKAAYAEYFGGSALEKNKNCADRAFKETKIVKFEVKQ
jgi:pyruvate ferredoxin oxidoreductase gamma subunit